MEGKDDVKGAPDEEDTEGFFDGFLLKDIDAGRNLCELRPELTELVQKYSILHVSSFSPIMRPELTCAKIFYSSCEQFPVQLRFPLSLNVGRNVYILTTMDQNGQGRKSGEQDKLWEFVDPIDNLFQIPSGVIQVLPDLPMIWENNVLVQGMWSSE
ncbi:hypothetical protein C5167_008571 [Papaver somniferum]|uniref:Uncharacterized protein n=1 Tax=Papaver somniferum TaxID=3469 RepID=A0A4Y7JUX9_PAPSO|nr:hypothetical protein C5167_008571 [Papaver somniferum]